MASPEERLQLTAPQREAPQNDFCGPATPNSPCGSSGLAYSEFARHYCRNHGCFLFLRVLRWFTSPSLLSPPMYSAENNKCLHSLGSPIRKSPDHRLLASPRGLSQLATSFIAYLCQGIHTHALSSLTIKFTLNTEYLDKKPVARSQEPECAPNHPTTGHLSMRYQPPRSRQARRFLQTL